MLIILATLTGNAQTNPLVQKIESYHKNFPKENLYLILDKPYYNTGDTLWFKSVLLNANHSASTRTDKIYVELFNDAGKFMETRVISLNNGLGYGDFALKNTLPEGTYTIRAYSNWQQNFGTDYFFQKSFYVGNINASTWLLDSYQKLNTNTARKNLDLKIRITNVKNEAAGLHDVEVYLMNDQKRIMRADLQTSLTGVIETQIPLGEEKISGNYSFYIIDKKDQKKRAMLPILLQDIDEIDLQFMPEGGHLVNGIYGRVGFKAIGADGKGRDIKLKVVDTKNEVVAEASTLHKGMGSFYLLPKTGEKYTALYAINGIEKKQDLPISNEEGTAIRIDHLSKPDSLLIYIKASESNRKDEHYHLVAQAAEENIMTLSFSLKSGFTNLKIAKAKFPEGIIHFTLFSPEQLPLNERRVFINYKHKINLNLKTAQESYNPRDSISFDILATKEDGSPLSGTFAVSITDDEQIKQEANEENIGSYFLLQASLKGNIEDPGWYFANDEPLNWLALDHLLLTQAWVGYDWDDVLKPVKTPEFKAEKDNLITGKVTGLFNKPAANINLTLLSMGKSFFVTDTISNGEGRFVFRDLPLIDSAAYTIKLKNAKGKTAAATIAVDEFKAANDKLTINPVKPWYVNADSTMLNFFKSVEKQRKLIDSTRIKPAGNQLKEVVILGNQREKEFVEKTAWDAKFFKKITEDELKQMRRKTLLDLLKEKIPNFTSGSFYADGCFGESARPKRHDFSNFLFGSSLISHVMIDKINTHVLNGKEDNYQENTNNISITANDPDIFATNSFIFSALSAEDIVDITIYKGCNNYFLDITTRSGKGPWIAPAKGVYVYKPLPLYVPREFYSPKYGVNHNSTIPDLRSTIFWDANVVTDENGKAKLSFYAADLPGSYTIKVEGTDLMGRFGYQKSKVIIVDKGEPK
ncbi:MG2 domain-containing protein [Pedobacter insulae]|uniref:MG2 domain-containing protein n=1 Tax=Pedobacter insulae TaxID=414048 RepID=UPI0011607AE2|nr:MG2 domain-containing protein [Pedobacter insulae]